MINVKDKKCEFNNCNIVPTYNTPGFRTARFCCKHKMLNMIDIRHKTCEIDGCNIRPTFNINGKTNARFCVKHKEINMINIIDKKCENYDCNKQPDFNICGEKTGKFCYEHKLDNMINVTSKKCEFNNCKKTPLYNIVGETKGRFCGNHKEYNMINVLNKICESNNCNIRASYGFLGNKIAYCALHKQKGMIFLSTKKCQTPKCKHLGCYELNGTRYCETHKPNEADNLGIAKCTICNLDDILVNGKCSTCDPFIIKNRQHAKENRVRDILNVAGFTFIHDKILESATCGKERPDFQIDCGTHFLYIEVDENQHQSYVHDCEQIRMINLVEVRGIPVRFIRYNPDYYKPYPKQKYIQIEEREKKLIEYIKYAIINPPNNCIADVIYLFYDEYDISTMQWITLIK